MRTLSKLFGLAAVMAAAAIYVSGCDANGNLVDPSLTTGEGQALTTPACEPDDPASCAPTGAHQKHAAYACSVCHAVAGRVSFSKPGPARAAGQPVPGFDPVAKTCSNVACHGMYSGTYSYVRCVDTDPDTGLCIFQTFTVAYAGNGGAAPSWYATGLGCSACHGNPPPAYGSWHGSHANGTIPGRNDCQLCHEDAIGVNGVGTAISTASTCGGTGNNNGTLPCAPFHGNGVVEVKPRYRSACTNCH